MLWTIRLTRQALPGGLRKFSINTNGMAVISPSSDLPLMTFRDFKPDGVKYTEMNIIKQTGEDKKGGCLIMYVAG